MSSVSQINSEPSGATDIDYVNICNGTCLSNGETMQEYSDNEINAEPCQNLLDLLSTHFLICTERVVGKGEDCGCELYRSEAGIIGVFDGCGGLGAGTCPNVKNMTEAYLASRAIGAAAKEWFEDNAVADHSWKARDLKALIIRNLSICEKNSGNAQTKFKGSLVRPFPSTLAMIVFENFGGKLKTNHIWAGDSRTYILDSNGLAQISIDDTYGGDALNNITNDGTLTNLVSLDGNFQLHSIELRLNKPCICFCSSDGCFAYLSSPMEYEYILISKLMSAKNIDEWECMLRDEFDSYSGDDQTFALAAFGFDNFGKLKEYYQKRYAEISRIFDKFSRSNDSDRQMIWNKYKNGYYRYYLKRG